MERTTIFLNTWGLYNMSYEPEGKAGSEWGYTGYGWMTPEEAREFIKQNPERDGGEWFIADIDNYTGVDFGNLNYCNVMEVIDTIETLEAMDEQDCREIVALMEYLNTSVQDAIEKKDNHIFYNDIDSYYDSMDELLDFSGCNEIFKRYFDFEAYHSDCDFDISEMSNGIVICH